MLTAPAEAGGINLTYGEFLQRRITVRMRTPMPPENVLLILSSVAQSGATFVSAGGARMELRVAKAGD